jgi:hypothetical protein
VSAPGNRAAAGARLGGVVGQSFCLLAPGPPPARGAPATTGGPRGVKYYTPFHLRLGGPAAVNPRSRNKLLHYNDCVYS